MSGMEDNHIDDLIAKLSAGTLTEKELAVLIDWYNSFDDTHAVLQGGGEESAEQLKARMHVWLMERIRPKPRRSVYVRLLPYAAAVLLAAVAIGYFADKRLTNTVATEQFAQDIAPGGNRATLIFADGRQVALSEEQEGIVVGDAVTYTDGSMLLDGQDIRSVHRDAVDLVLATPKGGTYQVMLPDGTLVWLNAASTLKYPTKFTESERVVELTGEAYFSVKRLAAADSLGGKRVSIPFKVLANGQEIEVLGTEFNIAAYSEDAEMKTTLVSGKVKVVTRNQAKVLHPGQQASLSAGRIRVETVETAPYVAWKEGRFHFQRTPLEEILKQISRWYDVDVVYRKDVPKETFSGKVKRNVSLMGVLNILQLSTIDIKLEGRTLIVD